MIRPRTRWFITFVSMGLSAMAGGLIVAEWQSQTDQPMAMRDSNASIRGGNEFNVAAEISEAIPEQTATILDTDERDTGISYFPEPQLVSPAMQNTSAADQVEATNSKAKRVRSEDVEQTTPTDRLVPSSTASAGAPLQVEPQAISPPDSAAPIGSNNRGMEQSLRRIINRGLPHSTQEERDIWFSELSGMPQEMVQEILDVRRQLGGHQSPLSDFSRHDPASLPSQIGESSLRQQQPRLAETGHSVKESTEELVIRFKPTIATLVQVHKIILDNIANANTIGFKRSFVLIEDASQPAQSVLTDPAAGSFLRTGRPMDLAILGDGWFQIRRHERICYTRKGAFRLGKDHKLSVTIAGENWGLDPAIVVPAKTTSVLVSPGGLVSAGQSSKDAELAQVGQLRVARFLNASGLKQVGPCLFEATHASGAATLVEVDPRSDSEPAIKQFFLEQANVDAVRELTDLKRVQNQIDAIQQAMEINSHRVPGGPTPISAN